MIGVLVSGEGTNLQALIEAGLPIAAVASNNPGAPALARAEASGIPTCVFDLGDYPNRNLRDEAMAAWLQARHIELVVCAGYMQLLTAPFLDRFPERIVNVHPSLLPEFPGIGAVEAAIAAGAETTGVTIHVVDQGLDSGPILRQEPVPVEPRETLRERIQATEHRILPQVVRQLCER
jgi:phosphoribosylglycinamide formyltransferase-1